MAIVRSRSTPAAVAAETSRATAQELLKALKTEAPIVYDVARIAGADDDAKMAAALALWAAIPHPICLGAKADGTDWVFNNRWLIANTGGAAPQQASLEIYGDGASHNGQGAAPLGGTIVDHRYNGRNDAGCGTTNGSATVTDASAAADDLGAFVTGTGIPAGAWIDTVTPGVSFTMKSFGGAAAPATATGTVTLNVTQPKIDSRGHGLIHLRDMTLTDTSGGKAPFFRTTNTTSIIERVQFYGSKTGQLCDQDAIILGGGTRTVDGTGAGKFNGYGHIVWGCFFAKVRRNIWGRPGCNNGVFFANTTWSNCGAADTTAGAYQFEGDDNGTVVGNVVTPGTLEVSKYPAAVIIGPYASLNKFDFIGEYDSTGVTEGGYLINHDSNYNEIAVGYSVDSFPMIHPSSDTTSLASTEQDTNHSGQHSVIPQPQDFTHTGSGGGTTIAQLLLNGDSGANVIQSASTQASGATPLVVKRSAAEVTNPGATIWNPRYNGGIFLGDVVSAPSTPASGAYIYPLAGKVRFKPQTTEAITGSAPTDVAASIVARLVALGLFTDSTTPYTPAPDVLATYVMARERAGILNATSGSAKVLLDNGASVPLVASGNSAPGVLYWDPADYAVADHTTYMRLRLSVITNDVGPGADITLTLKPFTSPAGAANVVGGSLGAAVTGSSVAVTGATANGLYTAVTADFTPPVAGFYALCVALSTTMTASSSAVVRALMQVKNV